MNDSDTTLIKPTFFIIGAPKCATTALYSYLKDHPNILTPEEKEIHFFSDDFPGQQKVHSLEEYLGLFETSNEKKIVSGEASVCYLYSDEAIDRILDFNSNAKFIVQLRNPVEMVTSLHSQILFNYREVETDFQKAWGLQEERSQGFNIPKHCRDLKLLQYEWMGKMGNRIEYLLSKIPRERVLFLLFDDFVRDTLGAYKSVLAFLNVPYDGKIEFPQVNDNKEVRFRQYVEFLRCPPYWLLKKVNLFKKIFGIEELGVKNLLSKKVKRKQLDPSFEKELRAVFLSDIEKIERILNRDLSSWKS